MQERGTPKTKKKFKNRNNSDSCQHKNIKKPLVFIVFFEMCVFNALLTLHQKKFEKHVKNHQKTNQNRPKNDTKTWSGNERGFYRQKAPKRASKVTQKSSKRRPKTRQLGMGSPGGPQGGPITPQGLKMTLF